MKKTKKTSADLSPEEYNEPVYYCLSCHSLCIMDNPAMACDGWDGSYCGKCNSTDIGVCSIGDWMKEEERRERKRKELEWRR